MPRHLPQQRHLGRGQRERGREAFQAGLQLGRNGRRAGVTALVNCPDGAPVDVRISVDGRVRFDAGPAEASAVIDVRRRGDVIDHQEWTREVVLQLSP